jgi:hypothetical protein
MMAQGGYRQPQRPAATSGPGALSQRTDGGAGNAKQPIRVPTGGKYGEAKALREQQQAAPMSAGGSGGAPTANIPPPGGAPGAGMFGPSNRPAEPITAGAPQASAGDPITQNPQAFLRVLATKFPHPAIQRLVDWSVTGGPNRT